MDFMYIGYTVAFFASCWALLKLCQSLMGDSK
jgi:hypothetical protein